MANTKRDRHGREITDKPYVSADPTILRTRTCRYLLSIIAKCLKVMKNYNLEKTIEMKKIESEVDYIRRTIKKEFRRHPPRVPIDF